MSEQYEILNLGFKGVDQMIAELTTRKMVIVLAQGIDATKTSKHLYISEFPPAVNHPQKEFFKQRNRIIAALSEQLILFSAKKDGGINNLVTSFLNLGKEISCFPGDGSENDGNSELIKEGANLITNIKEIY